MTFQDWGSIGELVSGIATVATLVYLAFQIRQNSKSLRAGAYQEATRSANEWGSLFINRPEIANLFARGIDDYRSLEPDERLQFNQIVSILFRNYSIALDLTNRGMIPRDSTPADMYEQNVQALFARKGMRDWWKGQPKSGAEFESHIDSLLEKAMSSSK